MTPDDVRRVGGRARLAGLGLLAAALLVACAGDDGGSETARRVLVLAGPQDRLDPAVAVLAYLPESVTVAVGGTVEWRFPGAEQHTVTFFPTGQSPLPPGSDPPAPAPTPGPRVFDGTRPVDSGPVPGPPPVGGVPFEVTFPTAGTYAYVCLIHPRMTGTVNVVDADADTQAAVDARARAELDRWVDEGRAARRALDRNSPRSEPGPDGTTTWRIEMGTTTRHTDVLAFSPTQAEIPPGDRVVFVNEGGRSHTATFAGRQPLPTDPAGPLVAAPAPGPSPQVLNASDLFGTGILAPGALPDVPPGPGPPPAAGTFTFVAPTAGTYSYVCVLHRASGMAGSVKVA